jgi:hypothetical protein
MFICPLCNQLSSITISCPTCHEGMDDQGRVMDYYDDYSAYSEIEDMKLEDGYADNNKRHQCVHYFYCSKCEKEQVEFIKEKIY